MFPFDDVIMDRVAISVYVICHIRESRDYVYGIWQYKVLGIKRAIWEERIIDKTWVMYMGKNINKRKKWMETYTSTAN